MMRRWLRRGVHRTPMRREHPSWPPPRDPFLWNQPTQILVQLKPCCVYCGLPRNSQPGHWCPFDGRTSWRGWPS